MDIKKIPLGDGRGNEMVCVFVASCFQQKKSEKMGRLVVSGVLEELFWVTIFMEFHETCFLDAG